MPIVGAITLYTSLLMFTLRVHPDRLDYVDLVLVCYLNSEANISVAGSLCKQSYFYC